MLYNIKLRVEKEAKKTEQGVDKYFVIHKNLQTVTVDSRHVNAADVKDF